MDKNQAIELIRQSSLSVDTDLLVEHLLPSARIVVCDGPGECAEYVMASHFGGLPSLPRNAAWPVWDNCDFQKGQIARLEDKFRANPRATGLRDIALGCGKIWSGPSFHFWANCRGELCHAASRLAA
jgi:hypothetical protein